MSIIDNIIMTKKTIEAQEPPSTGSKAKKKGHGDNRCVRKINP